MFNLITASSEGLEAFCKLSLTDAHVFLLWEIVPAFAVPTCPVCTYNSVCCLQTTLRTAALGTPRELHITTCVERQDLGNVLALDYFFSVPPRGHKFRRFWPKVCCSTLDQSLERCPGYPSLLQRNIQELQPALSGGLPRNFQVSWELGTRFTNKKVPSSRFVHLQAGNSC